MPSPFRSHLPAALLGLGLLFMGAGARASEPSASTTAAQAQAAPLQLCMSEFAPLNASSLSEGGPLARIVVQAFARSGIRAELRFAPWARVIKEGEAGECLIAGLWRNEARDQLFAYADPHYLVELGYFALKGVPRPTEAVSEAQAARICVQRGAYLPPSLAPVQPLLQMNADLPGCLRMLAGGRVDIAFGARAAGQHFLDSPAGRELGGGIEWRGPAVEVKEHLLAVRKTHPQRDALVQAFNRGLAQLRADGSYQRLLSAGGLSGQ